MAEVRLKKPMYPISRGLNDYLANTNREIDVPISYQDLMRFDNAVTLFDHNGKDTLWETILYGESHREFIHDCLRKVYAQLKLADDDSALHHLYIDRVDFCLYANTQPFRVRVVNKLNDLFDYFYIKNADMSRIYGMELEHLLSPNRIHYLVKDSTLIEEHIQGVPGDNFIKEYLQRKDFNELRIVKEFVKFNERCLVQLLGDMHKDNFVVQITPDFDELHFRMRAIDFDQQCYEGSVKIYMPQYMRENFPIVNLGLGKMSPVLTAQYQKEERMAILRRLRASSTQIQSLLNAMRREVLSTEENIRQLRSNLADLYEDRRFNLARTMGDLVIYSLEMLDSQPVRKNATIRQLG